MRGSMIEFGGGGGGGGGGGIVCDACERRSCVGSETFAVERSPECSLCADGRRNDAEDPERGEEISKAERGGSARKEGGACACS